MPICLFYAYQVGVPANQYYHNAWDLNANHTSSIMTQSKLEKLRNRYSITNNVVIWEVVVGENLSLPPHGWVAFSAELFKPGVRLLLHLFLHCVIVHTGLAPHQINLNVFFLSMYMLWREYFQIYPSLTYSALAYSLPKILQTNNPTRKTCSCKQKLGEPDWGRSDWCSCR